MFPPGEPNHPPPGCRCGSSSPSTAPTPSRTSPPAIGVAIAAGQRACIDGRHRHYIRLSFAEQPGTLELAVERLAAAWESHTQNLAASPAPRSHPGTSRQTQLLEPSDE